MTGFEVRKPSGELQMSTSTQFYDDGRAKFSHNALDERFDRAFTYDHAARTSEAYSGSEARDFVNNTNSGNPTGAYRQSYQFDPFDNITQQANRLWSDNETVTSSFTNNRNSLWSYDSAGYVTHDDSTSYARDAAGRTVQADSELSDGTYGYDGNGRVVKTVLQTPGFRGGTRTTTIHYLRSTVLGGAVAELNAAGQKTKRYVYAGTRKIAEDFGGSFNWSHEEPVTATLANSNTNGDYWRQAEMNADGINVGLFPPETTGFDTPEPIAPFGNLGLGSSCSVADPNCMTCYLDGFEHDCGHVMSLAQAGALQIQVQNSRGDTKWVDLDVVLGQLVTREWVDTRGRRPAPEKLPPQGVEVDQGGTLVINGYIPSGYWRYTIVSTPTFETGERRFAHGQKKQTLDEIYKTPPCPVASYDQLSQAQKALITSDAYGKLSQLQQAVFVNVTGALSNAGANLSGLTLTKVEDDRLLFSPSNTQDFKKSIQAGTKTNPQIFNPVGWIARQFGHHDGMNSYMVRQNVAANPLQVGFGDKGAFADIDLWNPQKEFGKHQDEIDYNHSHNVKTPHFYLAKVFGNCK